LTFSSTCERTTTMPIYAYRCSQCGHAQDVLQKISDPVLSVCPACGQATYVKQVTAAGFQLKGSGWYVTDFRDGKKPGKSDAGDSDKAGAKDGATAPAGDAPASGTPAPAGNGDGAKKSEAAPAAAAPSPAPAAAPAPATPSGKTGS
jgi:putative FmdB family regulatory protein